MMERLKAHLLFNSELKKHNSESGRVAETYKSEMRENEQQIYQDFKEMFSELKENWAENEVKVKESSAGFSDSINVNELLDKQEEIDKAVNYKVKKNYSNYLQLVHSDMHLIINNHKDNYPLFNLRMKLWTLYA